MEKQQQMEDGSSLAAPGVSPRDGQIDFSHYSVEQLRELEDVIDPDAFPTNITNLRAELARRSLSDRPEASSSPQEASAPSKGIAAGIFPGRFTPSGGLLGWLQAKSKWRPLYGDGVIEIRREVVLLRGWQRSWLGVPQPSELSLPDSGICDVIQHDDAIVFTYEGPLGITRTLEFHAESVTAAAALAAALPATRTLAFEKRWEDVRDHNDLLRAVGNRTYVTPLLVATNIVIYLAMAVAMKRPGAFGVDQLIAWGANFGPLTLHGQWWRLISALFLHANLAHVLLNMWALWNVGRQAERLFGSTTYACLYLVSGTLASLSTIVWNPGITSVGASGAIFGIIGAFIAFAVQPATRLPATLFRRRWISALVFVAFNIYTGATTPGVDNAAHVGGLIAGFVLGWLLARPLDAGVRATFPLRQSALATGFAVLAALGALWHARGIGDQLTPLESYLRTHTWYVDGERENLASWQQISAQLSAGSISNDTAGERFQREILPFWRKTTDRLKRETAAIPANQRQIHGLATQLSDLRSQAAQLVVEVTAEERPGRTENIVQLSKRIDLVSARMERIWLLSSLQHRPRALANSPWVTALRGWVTNTRWHCVLQPPTFGSALATTDSKKDAPALGQALGCQAQHLFMTGDYAALDASIRHASGSLHDLPDGTSTLAAMFRGMNDLLAYGAYDVQQMLERVADWKRAVKGSTNPDLIEAMIFRNWAWNARGAGYAHSVSAQQWSVFAHRTEMAAAALEDVEKTAATNPLWYVLAIDVRFDQLQNADGSRSVFDRGIQVAPGFEPLYRSMLRILLPRWGGSTEEIGLFVNELTNRRGGETGDLVLYARLYWIYSSLEQDRVKLFDDLRVDWYVMRRGMELLLRAHPDSDVILNAYAKFACMAGDTETYRRLRPQVKARLSAIAWSDAVTMASCDREHP